MKLVLNRDQLLEALHKVHSAVEKKNTIPILASILCKAEGQNLSLYATDLEVGMKVTLPVQIDEEGAVALSAKHFLDIVKELPAQSVLQISKKSNNWVELICEDYRFHLLGMSAFEYPVASGSIHFEEKSYIQARVDLLAEMIDKTIFSLSTDSALYHLNGVYLEPSDTGLFRMSATDLYRLSFIDREIFLTPPEFKKGIIIPKKGLTELRKLLDSKASTIGLSFERGYLFARIDNTSLFVRLLDGEYIDYRRIIPQSTENIATIDRAIFASALRRVSLLSDERNRCVKLLLQKNLMTISCVNPDMGEAWAKTPMEYSGEEIEIGFNARYLLDYLNSVAHTKVEFVFKDRLSAGILREPGQLSHTYVIMPMRL